MISPTPEGVGVIGGGLLGDSDAAFRFLGSGVAGRLGTTNCGLVEVACSSVGEADVVAGNAFIFFVDFGGAAFLGSFLFVPVTLGSGVGAACFARLRAERRSDIVEFGVRETVCECQSHVIFIFSRYTGRLTLSTLTAITLR